MAPAVTPPLVSVEEYLRTSYKPACEYIEGALRQKSMPTLRHSKLQWRIAELVNAQGSKFLALPELTLKIRADRFLVPDIAVGLAAKLEGPYPTEPVHLCVEIMSPEDRFAPVVAKCDEYLAWGVPTTWIVDPERLRAWRYESWPPVEVSAGEVLRAGEIAVPLDDIFRILEIGQ